MDIRVSRYSHSTSRSPGDSRAKRIRPRGEGRSRGAEDQVGRWGDGREVEGRGSGGATDIRDLSRRREGTEPPGHGRRVTAVGDQGVSSPGGDVVAGGCVTPLDPSLVGSP